jgi:hypothetical protein
MVDDIGRARPPVLALRSGGLLRGLSFALSTIFASVAPEKPNSVHANARTRVAVYALPAYNQRTFLTSLVQSQ